MPVLVAGLVTFLCQLPSGASAGLASKIESSSELETVAHADSKAFLESELRSGHLSASGREVLATTVPGFLPQITYSAWGVPDYIGGPFTSVTSSAISAFATDPLAKVLGFLNRFSKTFVLPQGTELILHRTETWKDGRTFVQISQVHDGIPVFASDVWFHFNPDGSLSLLSGTLYPEFVDPDIPLLSMNDALLQVPGATPETLADDGRLVFVDLALLGGGGPYMALAWELVLVLEGEPATVWVDALTGELLRRESMTRSAFSYEPRDARINGRDAKKVNGPVADTFDTLPLSWNAATVYDYWGQHGWSSYDNQDSPMRVVANYGMCDGDGTCVPGSSGSDVKCGTSPGGCPQANPILHAIEPKTAFWNVGPSFLAQTGAGVSASSQAVFCAGNDTLDFVAHEFGHAFNGATSHLPYSGVQGALDEHLSDCLAAMVDTGNWTLFEGSYFNAHYGSIRDVANPQNTPTLVDFGYPVASCGYGLPSGQPVHFTDYRKWAKTETSDFGGVHQNSGIGNKVCYLLGDTQGNLHVHGGISVAALGRSEAGWIFHYLQRLYLGSQAEYSQYRNALENAAYLRDLVVGDTNLTRYHSATNASDAVGIWRSGGFWGGTALRLKTQFRVASFKHQVLGVERLYVWMKDRADGNLKGVYWDPSINGYSGLGTTTPIFAGPTAILSGGGSATIYFTPDMGNYTPGSLMYYTLSGGTLSGPSYERGNPLTDLEIGAAYIINRAYLFFRDPGTSLIRIKQATMATTYALVTGSGTLSTNRTMASAQALGRVWLAYQPHTDPPMWGKSICVTSVSETALYANVQAQWATPYCFPVLDPSGTSPCGTALYGPAGISMALTFYQPSGLPGRFEVAFMLSAQVPAVFTFMGDSSGAITGFTRSVEIEAPAGRAVGDHEIYSDYQYLFSTDSSDYLVFRYKKGY
jgi:thermolysin